MENAYWAAFAKTGSPNAKGLPAGIQFVGAVNDDDAVLAAANLFQLHTNWHTKSPVSS